jgi:hypothetical protein
MLCRIQCGKEAEDTMNRGLKGLALIGLVLALAGQARASGFAAVNLDFLGRGRACGLAGAPGRLDNVFWNPSGLAWRAAPGGYAFAGYMDYLAGLKGGVAGYMGGGADNRAWGLYTAYLSAGSLTVTSWDDPTGGRGETFGYGELAGGLAEGIRVLPWLAVGGALKAAREGMDDEVATALLADLGITTKLGAGGHACIAARNLAIGTWGATAGEAPTEVEVGVGLEAVDGKVWGGCSVVSGRGGQREALVGLAALMSEEFEARIGYKQRIGSDLDRSLGFPWHRGLIAGFSVCFGQFWVDYTYEDATPLDSIHRLALRTLPASDRN